MACICTRRWTKGSGIDRSTSRLTVRRSPLHWSMTRSGPTGHVAAHALQITQNGFATLPDAGDFSVDQAFSYGAWIKLPPEDAHGAIVARMDNQHGYRGWDLWVEQRRVGTHIIHQWSDDALKVVSHEPAAGRQVDARARHLRRLEEGRRRAGLYRRRESGHDRPGRFAAKHDPHGCAPEDRAARIRPNHFPAWHCRTCDFTGDN